MTTNFKDALAKAAKVPTPKKSNGKKDVLLTPPKEIGLAIDNYVTEKTEMKKHEAQMKFYADPVIQFARSKQDEMARAGSFMTSFKLAGKNNHVTYVSSNRWTIPVEAETELRKLCRDKFDDLISEKWVVQVKDEVMNDNKLQTELMKLLGNKFDKFFTVERKLAPSATCDEQVYRVLDDDQLGEFRALARQYTPALK